MARSISKSIASAIVYILDPTVEFDIVDGKPVANTTMLLDGNPSMNKALIEAQKFCGHKNVMVLDIKVDETKVTVSPAAFMLNSRVCIEGQSYGREYITQTFKVTYYRGWYIDSDGNMVNFENAYNGETTDSKLRKHAIDACGSKNIVITEKTVKEERRYMRREKYMELAR